MAMATVGQSAMPDHRSWDDLKGPILKLYLEEQRTLREVKRTMESQYGFKATYATTGRQLCFSFFGTGDADRL